MSYLETSALNTHAHIRKERERRKKFWKGFNSVSNVYPDIRVMYRGLSLSRGPLPPSVCLWLLSSQCFSMLVDVLTGGEVSPGLASSFC